MKIGDYFDNQLCNVENIALSWAIDYPWEVRLQGEDEDDVQVLPHVLDVSMTLGAIHEFVPQADKQQTFFGHAGVLKDGSETDTHKGLFSSEGNDRDSEI